MASLRVSFLLLFVGVALFEKGDGFGLSGYLQVGGNEFMMLHLSFMYAPIFLPSIRNGLSCETHGLHIDDCVA